MRVAVTLQFNKDIITDDSDTLCFWATSGQNPNTKMIKGGDDKSDQGDVQVFHEQVEF